MVAPQHAVSLFSRPTNGSGSGKTEKSRLYVTVSFATLNHVIIKFRPARMPLPLFARQEGHDTRVRFFRLQFGNDSNAVADNRGGRRGVKEGGRGGAAWRSKTILSNLSYSGLKAGRRASICYSWQRVCSLLSHSHSKLARLVVGPFWAWIWTGGGPSVHYRTERKREISWTGNMEKSDSESFFLGGGEGVFCHVHWWGCALGGYMQRCGPAAAAGRSSGASALLREHPLCFPGPCLGLHKGNTKRHKHSVSISQGLRKPHSPRLNFIWKITKMKQCLNKVRTTTHPWAALRTRAEQTCQESCWPAAWQEPPYCCFPKRQTNRRTDYC